MIRPVIKKGCVSLARDLAAHAAATAAPVAAPSHAQRVKLVRVDGVVRALEVTCACGDTTVVELEYSNPTEIPR